MSEKTETTGSNDDAAIALKMFTETQTAQEKAERDAAESERDDLREKHSRQRETIRGVIEALGEDAASAGYTLGDSVRHALAQKDAEIARLKAALDGTLVSSHDEHDASLRAWHERHDKNGTIVDRLRAAGL